MNDAYSSLLNSREIITQLTEEFIAKVEAFKSRERAERLLQSSIPLKPYGVVNGISADDTIAWMKKDYEKLLEEKGKVDYALLNAVLLLQRDITLPSNFRNLKWEDKIKFINSIKIP